MKSIFEPGDQKVYETTVTEADTATFRGEQVHPVCATFALARDMEWSSRLFVLEMKDDDEEGIGTSLTIEHRGPALVGDTLTITATVTSLKGNSLVCNIEARVGDRLVATGTTGQKVLKKEKIKQLFAELA